jgi:EmrB/QacA subfamily drug resistance transporter
MSDDNSNENNNSDGNGKGNNLRWWILLTVIIGTFLGRLDQTIVNLALPKIITDYGISVTSAGWIATAYILANAIFVPIWGKLGDTIGQKKVYMLGFSIFILGSLLAGLAWDLNSMLVFRVIQAVAASADYPTAMAILALTFKPGKERAQALGIWSSSFAAAAVFGPLMGGPLIDNLGWRSVFYINVPIGLIGMMMAATFISESEKKVRTVSFDWWGAITLGISLSALVLVLDQGLTWGWTSLASLICYFVSAAFIAIFIKIEYHHDDAIVDLKFFKIKIFVNVLANNFIVFMVMMGSVFLIPIFAQTYLGYDATQTGYLFIPMAFMILLAAPLGGSLTGKVKPNYVIMASTLVAGIGLYLFSYLDPRSTAIDVIIPLAVMAFGLGFGMAQRTNIIASAVPNEEIGAASSVLALARNIAGAFGIAVFGTILQDSAYSKAIEISKYSVLNVNNPTTFSQFAGLIMLKAQVEAYDKVFVIAALITFFGAVTAYWIKVKHEAKLSEEAAAMLEAG